MSIASKKGSITHHGVAIAEIWRSLAYATQDAAIFRRGFGRLLTASQVWDTARANYSNDRFVTDISRSIC